MPVNATSREPGARHKEHIAPISVRYPFSSITRLLNSGKLWTARVARLPDALWKAINFSKSISERISALCTRKALSWRKSSAFFKAPPVPRTGSSGKRVTLSLNTDCLYPLPDEFFFIMKVDSYGCDRQRGYFFQNGFQHGFSENREQWFGDMIGDRTQPFPESGCKDEDVQFIQSETCNNCRVLECPSLAKRG